MNHQREDETPPRLALLVRLQRPWKWWLPLWKKRHEMDGKALHLFVMLVLMPTLLVCYLLIDYFSWVRGVTVWEPYIPLDDMIPTIPLFLIPYYSFFLLYPATVLLSSNDDTSRLRLMLLYQALACTALISFTFFLLLPAEVHRFNLEVSDGTVVDSFLSYPIIAFDRPYNAWPSLHASHTFLLIMMLWQGVKQGFWGELTSGEQQLACVVLGICMMFILSSALLTSQHFVFDIFTGLIVGMIAWRFMLLPSLVRLDPEETEWLVQDFND